MDPSPTDLAEVYGEVGSQLPRRADEDWEIVFSRENVPQPPPELSTSRFWFRRPGLKFYDNYPVPVVDVCIDKEGCRLLALLILARVLYPYPEVVDVHLSHHDMQLDLLKLRVENPWPDYRSTPESLTYYTNPVTEKHPPWTKHGVPPSELPKVEISTRDELGPMGREGPWPAGCDTVRGFGVDRASVRMAELLLNLALEDSVIDEVQFWSLFYYRSVAVGSAELVIWLPGSLGYIDED